MRKLILLSVLFFSILSFNLNAQDLPLNFGVKAGLNLSNVVGDVEGASLKVGFLVGVTVDYDINDYFIVLSGLEFTTKGFKSNSGDEASLNLSYLQLPMHIGYQIYKTEKVNFIVHAGPYVAYGLSAKYKEKRIEKGIEIETEYDFYKKQDGKAILNRCDFGAGVGFISEIGRIAFGVGFDLGLSNILNKNINNRSKNNFKMKNQNFNLAIGYKF